MKFILQGKFLRFFQIILTIAMFVIFAGMTDCGDNRKTNAAGDPNYTALKEGQGSYEAIITDEQSRIEVKEISFSGTTKIGGILYEQYDAVGTLELEALIGKKIKIIEDNFKSVRYPEKSLALAKVISEPAKGEKRSISGLFDVEIRGIDRKTGKTLFTAELLDGQNVSVLEGAEFSGVDKKDGRTLFNAKVVEVNTDSAPGDEGKEILIPRDVVVCGIDKKTGAGMAWLLRKIDTIEFKKQESKDFPEAAIDLKFKEAVNKTKPKK
jgi:hypothetical protein